jgi:arabinogalactan oligomer / maltooligosaccharide transport system substrate-binding protein
MLDQNLLRFFLLFLFLPILTNCQSGPNAWGDGKGNGTILLWHGWTETEAAALANVLQGFNEIHPNITVISQAVPAENLLQQYQQSAHLGLGPDLFIGPGEWLMPLADQGLILDVLPFQPDTEHYLSLAVTTMRYGDGLYGLPLALRPIALYYNTALVETPPANLDEWLAQAANGRSSAMDVNFLPSFWGIQAFGGRLFDETGQVVLAEGGYANWLRWMQNAQNAPGMILSRDNVSLQDLFFSGKVAYYTGSPDDLTAARAALGEENVSVASLPAGPVGPAGPLLYVEAFYFNPFSRPQQTEQALLLASFLTNNSQSTTLLREISRIPANRSVPVDSRLHPAEAGFAAQARTSVAVSNTPEMELIIALSDDLNRAALAGAVDVLESIEALAYEVNGASGLPLASAASDDCELEGVLRIWYPWGGRFTATIDRLVEDYEAVCPGATVLAIQIAPDEIVRLHTTLNGGDDDEMLPDLVLGPSTWLMTFIEAESIQPVTAFVSPEFRQRFLPATLGSLEQGSELFGVPYWIELDALYLNSALVNDPPATLDDFSLIAESSGAAITTTFLDAYWGATAYGSVLFTDENRLALVESGFVDWLTWLEAANAESTILLADDPAQLQAAFSAGEVGMLVAPASALGEIEQGIEPGNLRITQFPVGPAGEARPWLRTMGFFLTAELSEEQRELALSFTRFATNVTNQTFLMNEARLIPVNANVGMDGFPLIGDLVLSTRNVFLSPNVPEVTAVFDMGDQPYQDVLSGQKRPLAAACDFTIGVDRANGFSVAPADLPPPCR